MISVVLGPRQPLRGRELGQEELLHALGQHGLRDAGRRVTVVRLMAFHVVIAQQEIENLGVFRTDEPADFVGPQAQLLQLAELAVGLGFALQEEQDQLAGVAADPS